MYLDLAQCGLKRDNNQMQQYNDLGCGKNIELENCLYYKYKLEQNPNDSIWQKKIDNSKCNDVFVNDKNNEVGAIYGTYSDIDKSRIEADTKFQTKKRIFLGAMVFLSVVGILIINKK